MAQTKARASGARSRSSGKSRTGGSSSSGKARSTKARTTGKSGSSNRSSSAKSRSRRSAGQSKSSSNGTGRADAALHAVEDKAKDAGRAVGGAARKAKVPLVAGGAALAGAAGGLALGTRRTGRHKRMGISMPRRPQVKVVRSRDLANAAKEVGNFSTQVGRLASELQQSREENGKKRSPVEVVLDALTARH